MAPPEVGAATLQHGGAHWSASPDAGLRDAADAAERAAWEHEAATVKGLAEEALRCVSASAGTAEVEEAVAECARPPRSRRALVPPTNQRPRTLATVAANALLLAQHLPSIACALCNCRVAPVVANVGLRAGHNCHPLNMMRSVPAPTLSSLA